MLRLISLPVLSFQPFMSPLIAGFDLFFGLIVHETDHRLVQVDRRLNTSPFGGTSMSRLLQICVIALE